MTDKDERPVETRPLDLFYINVDGDYSSQKEYDVVPASDIIPQKDLENSSLNLTILNFFAGDLPGEDDWDARIPSCLANKVQRFSRAKVRNEAFLKLRVAYWKERREATSPGDVSNLSVKLDDGPYFADQAFQFVVEDKSRAGGFSDRRIFESIRIRESLVLQIELQELDEFEKDVAPYADVLKGTGLDAALQLSPQFSALIPIASGIVRNIAKLNKSDTVWDQEFTITTTRSVVGQSKLKEGIYVALESVRPGASTETAAAENSFEPQKLKYKNHRLLYLYNDKKLKPWIAGYLVFTINKTPTAEAIQIWETVKKHSDELPKQFKDDIAEAFSGAGGLIFTS